MHNNREKVALVEEFNTDAKVREDVKMTKLFFHFNINLGFILQVL